MNQKCSLLILKIFYQRPSLIAIVTLVTKKKKNKEKKNNINEKSFRFNKEPVNLTRNKYATVSLNQILVQVVVFA